VAAVTPSEDAETQGREVLRTPVKILVAKCFNTKCVFAHVVPQKGVDPERCAVDRLVKDIQWLGHSSLQVAGGFRKLLCSARPSVLSIGSASSVPSFLALNAFLRFWALVFLTGSQFLTSICGVQTLNFQAKKFRFQSYPEYIFLNQKCLNPRITCICLCQGRNGPTAPKAILGITFALEVKMILKILELVYVLQRRSSRQTAAPARVVRVREALLDSRPAALLLRR